MAFAEDWWDRDPEWRDLAYCCTSSAFCCAMCGAVKRSLQAIPANRNNPFGDLLAVCGQCKVAARRQTVAPEKNLAKPTIGPVLPTEITPARWRMTR